ncbi:MAG TPA: hypothetical protein VNG33_22950 [Polyangiaceae bacterium]|nr:hypothetical protein [Polyangiaceae bacterium]
MIRLLVVLALCLTACDESDPATSEHCVAIRMQYLERRYLMEQGAANGADPELVRQAGLAIAKFQSENWQCFK